MKFNAILLLAALIFLMFCFACDWHSHTEPDLKVDNTLVLGQAMHINESPFQPNGIDTLHVNEGDTVKLIVTTLLLKTPEYSWTPADNEVLKVVKDTDNEAAAYAIAIGDSGAATTLNLWDEGNSAKTTINVVIEKHWADPDYFNFIGSLGGHYYYISNDLKTWVQAFEACNEAGGYLATINSGVENNLLYNSRGSIENIWIGLKFNLVDNVWELNEWITGEPLDYENFKMKPTDPDVFAKYYFYMNVNGKWENWHEQPMNYFLEMN